MPKHAARAAVAAAWQARVSYQRALLASQRAGGQPLDGGGLRGSRSLDPGLCALALQQLGIRVLVVLTHTTAMQKA